MSVHTKIDREGIYFITFACYGWLPLIELSQGYDAVYNFFTALGKQNHTVLAYVIMPNHLHLLLHYSGGKNLNTVIGNGKRFMAYEIVDKLKKANNASVLKALSNARNATEIKANKQHKVFETSFDWKWCNSDKLLEQKLSYIHSNPCKGKWNLANSPFEYVHSSAKYYLTGEQGFYPVTHYKEIEEIDLHTLR